MRPGWTNFHPGSYFVSSRISHLSPPAWTSSHQFFFFPRLYFFLFLPTRNHPCLLCFSPRFFFFCPLLTSSVLSFSPLSRSQRFHHFPLIPRTPLPPPVHIFKHKPAHWFQTKCVHSNISINWVGEALTLITATTLCFRHVGGIMDYY